MSTSSSQGIKPLCRTAPKRVPEANEYFKLFSLHILSISVKISRAIFFTLSISESESSIELTCFINNPPYKLFVAFFYKCIFKRDLFFWLSSYETVNIARAINPISPAELESIAEPTA